MHTIYVASAVLTSRLSSHRQTIQLTERIAKAAKSGVYPVEWLATGKPVFTAGGRFLSVSHTGGRLFVAVSGCPLGMDAELRREVPERVRREWMTPEEQKQDFFAVWTAKEAVAKLDGRGLSILKKIHVYRDVARFGRRVFSLRREERDGAVITFAAADPSKVIWVDDPAEQG